MDSVHRAKPRSVALAQWLCRVWAYAWAAPYTAVGLLLGVLALCCGSRVQICEGVLEFGGGWLGKRVSRLRPPFAFVAITLGHVILAVDAKTLVTARAHEQVHVRQYERWGPLFVPAYLLSSLVQLLRGRHPYLDNHFEREAYAFTGTRKQIAEPPRISEPRA